MENDRWEFENRAAQEGFSLVCGVDEAGRGPLAGPVVAAAVTLPRSFTGDDVIDSKKLTPKKRDRLYDHIYVHADAVGIGIIDPVEIDRINILRAALLAMAIAVENLRPRPDYLLIDGNQKIPSAVPQKAVVGGDALSISIAAASIVAKVTRDRLMERYDQEFPEFGFARHKGYPTAAHREAIRRHGFCAIHRTSFKGVRELISQPCLPCR
ncbi:MAG: ribonuclease HII [Desulfobacterales bacterium]|jgi:ribonuclease HII